MKTEKVKRRQCDGVEEGKGRAAVPVKEDKRIVCNVGGSWLQSTRLETMQTQRKQSAKANSNS